jgi:hypothetical protein
LTGFGGVVVGSLITWGVQASLLGRRIKADETLAERKFEYDKKLAERKFEFDKMLSTHKLEADATLAEKKVQLDAALADRKRRQDFAEQILSGFYQMRDVARAIRAPLVQQGESKTRPQAEHESTDVARLKDTYYAPLARFDARRAEIGDLLAKRYRAGALFGAVAEEPFQELHEALTQIAISAQMLIGWVGVVSRQIDPNLWREAEGDIWARSLKPDPIETKIAAAIAKIEAICRPVLEAQPSS